MNIINLQKPFFRHSWRIFDKIYGEHGQKKAGPVGRMVYTAIFFIDRSIVNMFIHVGIWIIRRNRR